MRLLGLLRRVGRLVLMFQGIRLSLLGFGIFFSVLLLGFLGLSLRLHLILGHGSGIRRSRIRAVRCGRLNGARRRRRRWGRFLLGRNSSRHRQGCGKSQEHHLMSSSSLCFSSSSALLSGERLLVARVLPTHLVRRVEPEKCDAAGWRGDASPLPGYGWRIGRIRKHRLYRND